MTAPAPVPDGTTPPAEAVEAAIAELRAQGDPIHSWRCAYPERYGPCDCIESAGHDIAAAVVAALDLPRRDREAAAKAWDEGHATRWRRDPDDGCTCGAWASLECGCGRYGSGDLLSLNDNPYRASALRERRQS